MKINNPTFENFLKNLNRVTYITYSNLKDIDKSLCLNTDFCWGKTRQISSIKESKVSRMFKVKFNDNIKPDEDSISENDFKNGLISELGIREVVIMELE